MIWQQLIELVAPGTCAQCGLEGAVLCAHCRLDLRPAAKVCFRCLRPSLEGRTCAECRRLTLLEAVSVASHYDGAVKELILALKFHQLQAAAEVAAEMILAALPVSAGRYRERGYNQSRLIAKRVARSLRRPYMELLGARGHGASTGRGPAYAVGASRGRVSRAAGT